MSETAAAQLQRLLHLIPRCTDDEAHPVDELAQALGVDRKTLLADLRALTDRWNDPGAFVPGVSVYLDDDSVEVRSNHFLRPMRLTLPELAALELGLGLLRGEREPGEHALLERAASRLRECRVALPADAVARDLDLATASVGLTDEQVARLAVLRRGVTLRRWLRLAYQRGGASTPTAREVAPLALVQANGTWYLVADHAGTADLRFYRLDRVHEAELLERTFTPPEDFDLDAVVGDGRLFRGEALPTVRVRYSARVARFIAEREGVPVAEDGTLTLEKPLGDLDWAARHFLQYGPDVTVLAGEGVREEMVRRLETAGRR